MGHKNARWAAGSSPSWQCALAAWFRNHGGKLASGEEERVDQALGLSDYLASHDSALPAGHLRPGEDSSQAHYVEDSQPAPLQDEEMLTPGPPVAEGGWCRGEGITCLLCHDYTATQPRNLVRHLVARHCGQPLGEAGASTLRGCEQCICLSCKGIRSFKSTQCLHCAPPIRPFPGGLRPTMSSAAPPRLRGFRAAHRLRRRRRRCRRGGSPGVGLSRVPPLCISLARYGMPMPGS